MAKKSSKFLFYLLSGAGLGVMFAPKKGSEMVADIKRERAAGGNGIEAVKTGFLGMGRDMAATATAVYQKDEVQEVVKRVEQVANDKLGDVQADLRRTFRRFTKTAKKSFSNAMKAKTKFFRGFTIGKMEKKIKKLKGRLRKGRR